VTAVRNKVIAERRAWTKLFDELQIRYAQSHGNFVFFETRRPHQDVASALLREGVEIGRAFDLYDHWARISIGLPEENSLARTAIRKLLSA
jgi:histidinol-phosphate aminotransferase